MTLREGTNLSCWITSINIMLSVRRQWENGRNITEFRHQFSLWIQAQSKPQTIKVLYIVSICHLRTLWLIVYNYQLSFEMFANKTSSPRHREGKVHKIKHLNDWYSLLSEQLHSSGLWLLIQILISFFKNFNEIKIMVSTHKP